MTLFGSVQRLARLAPAGRAQLSTSAPVRGGQGWSYRTTPPPTTQNLAMGSKIVMTFTWWWIFHGNKHISTIYFVFLLKTSITRDLHRACSHLPILGQLPGPREMDGRPAWYPG